MALAEGTDEVTVEVPPGRLPVQQDNRLAFALIDIMLLKAIAGEEIRLPRPRPSEVFIRLDAAVSDVAAERGDTEIVVCVYAICHCVEVEQELSGERAGA